MHIAKNSVSLGRLAALTRSELASVPTFAPLLWVGKAELVGAALAGSIPPFGRKLSAAALQRGCRYRHTSYHKQTKNLWARDDPAFVVLLSALVGLTSAIYSLV